MILKALIFVLVVFVVILVTHDRLKSSKILVIHNRYRRILNNATNSFIHSHTQVDPILAYDDVISAYHNIDVIMDMFDDDIEKMCHCLNIDILHVDTLIRNINSKRVDYLKRLKNTMNTESCQSLIKS